MLIHKTQVYGIYSPFPANIIAGHSGAGPLRACAFEAHYCLGSGECITGVVYKHFQQPTFSPQTKSFVEFQYLIEIIEAGLQLK